MRGKSFASFIGPLREKAGYSYPMLESLTGIHKYSLQNYEEGKSLPNVNRAMTLLKVLQSSLEAYEFYVNSNCDYKISYWGGYSSSFPKRVLH